MKTIVALARSRPVQFVSDWMLILLALTGCAANPTVSVHHTTQKVEYYDPPLVLATPATGNVTTPAALPSPAPAPAPAVVETLDATWTPPDATKDGASFALTDGNLTVGAKQSGAAVFKPENFGVWQWAGIGCFLFGLVCLATPLPDTWGIWAIGGGVTMAILGAFLPVYGPMVGLALIAVAVVGAARWWIIGRHEEAALPDLTKLSKLIAT